MESNCKKNISIIVPLTRNDSDWLQLLPCIIGRADEIIFVSPRPRPLGLREDCWWVESETEQRAHQLNLGAIHAKGTYLWFLHADSILTREAVDQLTASLLKAPEAIHYFKLKFLPKKPAFVWLNQIGANLRAEYFKLPYGDQGLCMSKKTFAAIGGYNEVHPYAEDFYFIWTAKRLGLKIVCTQGTLSTSPRRYQKYGWFSTTLRHLSFTLKESITALCAPSKG